MRSAAESGPITSSSWSELANSTESRVTRARPTVMPSGPRTTTVVLSSSRVRRLNEALWSLPFCSTRRSPSAATLRTGATEASTAATIWATVWFG